MDSFELISKIVDLLRGKDTGIWHEILERTLNHEDPYTVRIPQVPILDVVWPDGIEPENLLMCLQGKEKMKIDEKIVAAFDQLKKDRHFSFRKVLGLDRGRVMIRFDPSNFGVTYDFYERSSFGFHAKVRYPKVVEAALKYGFQQPDLVSALYFRLRFLDAHRYSEGTSYYVGCEPATWADEQPPIIPVLKYNRYVGWEIGAQEIADDTLLDASFAVGQGECVESTFLFSLPRRNPA